MVLERAGHGDGELAAMARSPRWKRRVQPVEVERDSVSGYSGYKTWNGAVGTRNWKEALRLRPIWPANRGGHWRGRGRKGKSAGSFSFNWQGRRTER